MLLGQHVHQMSVPLPAPDRSQEAPTTDTPPYLNDRCTEGTSSTPARYRQATSEGTSSCMVRLAGRPFQPVGDTVSMSPASLLIRRSPCLPILPHRASRRRHVATRALGLAADIDSCLRRWKAQEPIRGGPCTVSSLNFDAATLACTGLRSHSAVEGKGGAWGRESCAGSTNGQRKSARPDRPFVHPRRENRRSAAPWSTGRSCGTGSGITAALATLQRRTHPSTVSRAAASTAVGSDCSPRAGPPAVLPPADVRRCRTD